MKNRARELSRAIENFRTAHEAEEFVKREMKERFPDDLTDDGRQVCLI